jgi:hypothetical protein
MDGLYVAGMPLMGRFNQEKQIMRSITKKLASYLVAGALTLSLALPSSAYATMGIYNDYSDEPSGGMMLADALMVRPGMFVGTLGTTIVYVVTLPFSLLGGNAGEAGRILVKEPAAYTFVRPLGEF